MDTPNVGSSFNVSNNNQGVIGSHRNKSDQTSPPQNPSKNVATDSAAHKVLDQPTNSDNPTPSKKISGTTIEKSTTNVTDEAKKTSKTITKQLMQTKFKTLSKIPIINSVIKKSLKEQITTQLKSKDKNVEFSVKCILSKTITIDSNKEAYVSDRMKAEGSFKEVSGLVNLSTRDKLVKIKEKPSDTVSSFQKENKNIEDIHKLEGHEKVKALPMRLEQHTITKIDPKTKASSDSTIYIQHRGQSGDNKAVDPSFTNTQRLHAVRDIAESLAFINKNGYVHGDIKPANILFDDKGQAHLADLEGAKTPKTYNPIAWTDLYVNPNNETRSDLQYDAYALTLTAFELLTGTNYVDNQKFLQTTLQNKYGADTGNKLYMLINDPNISPCQDFFEGIDEIIKNAPENLDNINPANPVDDIAAQLNIT